MEDEVEKEQALELAVANVREAIKDKPRGSLSRVNAADVILVGSQIPAGKATLVCVEMLDGVRKAGNKPDLKVLVHSHQLAHLLRTAGYPVAQ